jgi:hypothetical protein
MNREELVFKKRELQRQIDVLKRDSESIDRVLELFPEDTPSLPGVGVYSKMSVAKAIIDFLSRTPGWYVTVTGIAAALKAEGIKSSSDHFTTIVSATCIRLAKGKKGKPAKLVRKTKNNRNAFAVPTTDETAEKE